MFLQCRFESQQSSERQKYFVGFHELFLAQTQTKIYMMLLLTLVFLIESALKNSRKTVRFNLKTILLKVPRYLNNKSNIFESNHKTRCFISQIKKDNWDIFRWIT